MDFQSCIANELQFAGDYAVTAVTQSHDMMPELTDRIADSANVPDTQIGDEPTAFGERSEKETPMRSFAAKASVPEGGTIYADAFELAGGRGTGCAQRDDGILALPGPGERKVVIESVRRPETGITDAEAAAMIQREVTRSIARCRFDVGVNADVEGFVV